MTRKFAGVVTVGRSDYGLYRSVLKELDACASLDYGLYVGGAHLDREMGYTIENIEADGHPIVDRIEMSLTADSASGMAKSIGLGVMGFSEAYRRRRPDVLVVLGDRFEMLSAVIAASAYKIPVAHIHGGEITEGAVDNLYRHAITKMAHVHFVSTKLAAKRVAAMGEMPDSVIVTGAPGLDALRGRKLSRKQLEKQFGVPASGDFLLVTYHPVTMEPGQAVGQIREIMRALDRIKGQVVFTLANADPEGRAINREIAAYTDRRREACVVANFGERGYLSAMSHALAMVGNSSSGIIEAASFELPVVNVGSRQDGRERSSNVLDVKCTRGAVEEAIRKAVSARFRKGLKGMRNIYGTGDAGGKIVEHLRRLNITEELLRKRFHLSGAG